LSGSCNSQSKVIASIEAGNGDIARDRVEVMIKETSCIHQLLDVMVDGVTGFTTNIVVNAYVEVIGGADQNFTSSGVHTRRYNSYSSVRNVCEYALRHDVFPEIKKAS
jgi:hypothetical protein